MDKRHIGSATKSLMRRIDKAMSDLPVIRDNENLTGMQGWILNFLFRRAEKGDVFQKDVEAEFKIRRSTATEALKNMEKSGLIRRIPVDYDARLKKIVLTEHAEDIKKQIESQILKTEKRLVEGFTDAEVDAFLNYVERFKKNLENERAE